MSSSSSRRRELQKGTEKLTPKASFRNDEENYGVAILIDNGRQQERWRPRLGAHRLRGACCAGLW